MTRTSLILGAILAVLLTAGIYVLGVFKGWHGHTRDAGEIVGESLPAEMISARTAVQLDAVSAIGSAPQSQILFGDLHVHSTFSTDAFIWALPMLRGEGANQVADACDFARYCSALDFWAMTDHAEALTPTRWLQSINSVQQCAARSDPEGPPDVIPFIGFEWTQVGSLPEQHYGHKNVIFETLDVDAIAARPIAAAGTTVTVLRDNASDLLPPQIAFLDLENRQNYYDFGRFVAEVRDTPLCDPDVASADLPLECYELAGTPGELIARLESQGLDPLIIPHGSSWGLYTPPGTSWEKQLQAESRPDMMRLIEVFSGHGNSEEYRAWRPNAGTVEAPVCPEPVASYMPSCWRAGEIIEERCLSEGFEEAECADRAAEARFNSVYLGLAGHLTVLGEGVHDWLDAGQCRDCFLPAFNHNPTTSVQYGLAITNFDEEDDQRFQWGFIGSSDTHTARPGIGYKPFERHYMTDASGTDNEEMSARMLPRDATSPARSQHIERAEIIDNASFRMTEIERQASFFTGGGLAAVHVTERSRSDIWSSMENREVYATSGLRQLLWFDLVNGDGERLAPMGADVDLAEAPVFEVRAVGSLKQNPGCPDESVRGLPADRLAQLCRGECYNPGNERNLITRIEVVRIRPQISPDESVDLLVEDVWQTLPCDDQGFGCQVQFTDPGFASGERDVLYYVRAIQEPGGQVNGDNLRCEYDENGACVAVDPCMGDYRTDMADDCIAMVEHRAWSSPIYVGFDMAADRHYGLGDTQP